MQPKITEKKERRKKALSQRTKFKSTQCQNGWANLASVFIYLTNFVEINETSVLHLVGKVGRERTEEGVLKRMNLAI